MAFIRGGIGKLTRKITDDGRESISFEEYLTDYECYSLFLDGDQLLVGSAYEIILFDRKKGKLLQTYSSKDGLEGDSFTFVSRDNKGRIWFNNKKVGFYDIDQKKTYYPRTIENEFFIIPIHRYQNKDYFVVRQIENPKGLVRFNHHSYKIDSVAPAITIEGVWIQKDDPDSMFNAVTAFNHLKLTLPWDQNNLEITYNGLHFDDPDRNRFQYRLLGASKKWVEAGKERIARYVDLSPKSYTFEVKAANGDGVWSSPKQLQITIKPPFWRTWWANTLYTLGIFGLLYFAYRFQLRRQLALQEAQKYKEIDQVKSRLYTNITHEFRTPLTIVEGLVDQIQEHSDLKQIIRRNTRQLLNLVNQLLDLAKLEVGKLALNESRTDIIPFTKYIVQSLQSLANTKGVDLQVNTEIETLITDIDRDKFKDIVTNLVSNAIKYTPKQGKILVEIKQLDRYLLEITVADTGIGISPAQLPHIFDRFYQADNSLTRSGEGTGIGLALVQELTSLMEGEVEVKSEVGKGSSFFLRLPIKHELSAELEEEVFPDIGLYNLPKSENVFLNRSIQVPRALIVEDNDDVIYYLKSLLSDSYHLFVARNGREGIAKAKELTPDIILSDVMMPEVDGFELCDSLKQDIQTSHIPIILLTAKGDIDSKISGLSRGADAYLSKPFNPQELKVRIEQLIASREKLRSIFSTGEPLPENLKKDPVLMIENSFLEAIRNFVHEHIDNPDLSIPEVAASVHVERSQLYRKVHALTGMSPSVYIRKIRLNYARDLLKSPNMNISEVVMAVGFKDSAYFSRKYKEEFGVAPKSG